MRGFAIHTRSGKCCFPPTPSPDDVDIEDAAAGLANQGGFNGQTSDSQAQLPPGPRRRARPRLQVDAAREETIR
jgi:hypothetical protein